ncbi:hypothetical protein PUN28_011604 [Cardiocondyla obscurior]|uniref:Uncharacterized protein n=1 Tax=Cardiocondyla obscurior TaxID=286306 RepID=A0AAW2FHE9_9HYME
MFGFVYDIILYRNYFAHYIFQISFHTNTALFLKTRIIFYLDLNTTEYFIKREIMPRFISSSENWNYIHHNVGTKGEKLRPGTSFASDQFVPSIPTCFVNHRRSDVAQRYLSFSESILKRKRTKRSTENTGV